MSNDSVFNRQCNASRAINLVGPGGAGKSTTGQSLADRLALGFVDLDAAFTASQGDISTFIETCGYEAYARANIDTYAELWDDPNPPAVVALSSGFMTYADNVQTAYRAWRDRILASPRSFVLLPSMDLEACVAETVRRQLARPFARAKHREESVIRSRFPIYASLPVAHIVTGRPVAEVVDELLARLRGLSATG